MDTKYNILNWRDLLQDLKIIYKTFQWETGSVPMPSNYSASTLTGKDNQSLTQQIKLRKN
jgi:hypothetical protein